MSPWVTRTHLVINGFLYHILWKLNRSSGHAKFYLIYICFQDIECNIWSNFIFLLLWGPQSAFISYLVWLAYQTRSRVDICHPDEWNLSGSDPKLWDLSC